MIDVSIIVPSYNAAKTIAASLRSCIDQDDVQKEIIVIDGNSSDESLTIIQSFGDQISSVISEQDQGVYDAMNKGIRRAKGKWIFILGADDYFDHPTVLRDAMHEASLHPQAELLFGSVENINRIHPRIPSKHQSRFDSGLYWRNTLHSQRAIYRAALIQANPFDLRFKILSDYHLHLKLFKAGTKAVPLPFTLARCEASGLSKKFPWTLYQEELRLKKDILPLPLYLLNCIVVPFKYLYKR